MRIKLILFGLILSFQGFAQLHDGTEDLPCMEKTFHIFAHIGSVDGTIPDLYEEEVVDAIDAVSRFFEPICVEIETCELEIMENPNFNEPEAHLFGEMIRLHSRPNRIDLFVVRLPGGCYNNFGNILSASEGNIFIDKGCLNEIAQAFGTFFNLKLTHERSDGVELVDGSNCETAGDGICDTPADPYLIDTLNLNYYRHCEFIYDGVDANGDYYNPDMGNVMSTYAHCWCGFSREQLIKMYNNIRRSIIRYW